ncbi:type II toxin-antitoxin system PemK/MazF family toxin [Phormidium sp. FACHB-1136]|uniref:type II toxin-antitoxin system PemK/MazF family toxin n=1 Tax=Phormidium sp. FACHB-1136 TaxID=2692848 RepID=UPI00168860D8|nr:type II toxin-antitoxin system PemK/MazF family toxin [Phormidium sp. FACHB-1136]MBD2425585.1 type II toxin-antitoxin system PemK/MazF family toxin [Phormidium sp. FACHB-1136]
MTTSPGEFWVADIPFTNGQASKKRPVLVLWQDGLDVVVAAVTSAQPRTQTDVLLQDWQQSGLRVPSTVRLSRLDCLEGSLFLAKIGTVTVNDAAQFKTTWSEKITLKF